MDCRCLGCRLKMNGAKDRSVLRLLQPRGELDASLRMRDPEKVSAAKKVA